MMFFEYDDGYEWYRKKKRWLCAVNHWGYKAPNLDVRGKMLYDDYFTFFRFLFKNPYKFIDPNDYYLLIK